MRVGGWRLGRYSAWRMKNGGFVIWAVGGYGGYRFLTWGLGLWDRWWGGVGEWGVRSGKNGRMEWGGR